MKMARGRGIHSIRGRLFLLFLSSMMVLLMLGSYLYYRSTTDLIHEKISDMAEKNISQTAGLFDLLLEGYISVTKSLNSNYELLRLLQEREKEKDPVAGVNVERMIQNIMGAVFYSRKDIIGIHIITDKGKIYTYENRFPGATDDVEYVETDWFKKLEQSSGEAVWMGLYEGPVFDSSGDGAVFAFGRKLYDLSTYQTIGVLLIETDPRPILEALSNVTISPNSRVYIVDKEDKVVASTEWNRVQAPTSSGLPRPTSYGAVVENREGELVAAAQVDHAEWTVFGLTPEADIHAEIIKTRKYLIIVSVLLVLLSIALATLISRNISSPLKLLIRQMRQVERGNFRGAVNVRSFEEINSLVSSFNRMVRRMDELIERITLASISEKNAELQALQSQVNPHFLYNTLDMIYWMLDERENDRLGRVILALSHMFRYSSDWQEASRTTLRQELDQMRHYMTIIESRLEGRVHAEIDVDRRWLDVPLPKMTIQPIIENAVKSGLEPVDRPGKLRVYTQTTERELLVVIEDNGIGIEETALHALRASLYGIGSRISEDRREVELIGSKTTAEGADQWKAEATPTAEEGKGSRKGIGLPNVHRRIALMFGEAYGLRINSIIGSGTTVIVVMPLPAIEEDDDHELVDCRR